MRSLLLFLLACVAIPLFVSAASAATAADEVAVALLRVPDGGIQPQVGFSEKGTLHLVYFRGDPAHGNLLYVRSADGGANFSKPLQVNSRDGSAIALGTIRGARLAIGRGDRVHVAWMGSNLAEPKAPGNLAPMLYARLNDAGSAFEPQRNLIQRHPGLDGGGAVAADGQGNVYVAWHAPDIPRTGEAARRVWAATSSDDGKTFADEIPAIGEPTGACACCGMALLADPSGRLFALYRTATNIVDRDTCLLVSDDRAATFKATRIGPMRLGKCIMSSPALASGGSAQTPIVLAGWETRGQVYWAIVGNENSQAISPIPAPGSSGNRKYPALAVNASGEVLMAWTEGMAWEQGGSLAWQIFDANGRPLPGRAGHAPNVPMWDLPAAFVRPDGSFAIIY